MRSLISRIASLAARILGKTKDAIHGEHLSRQRRIVRLMAAVAVALLGLLAGVVYEAWSGTQQRNAAMSQQLTAASRVLREDEPRLIERSALLAIESARRQHTSDTDAAVRYARAVLPRTVLRLENPPLVAFREGRLLALPSATAGCTWRTSTRARLSGGVSGRSRLRAR